MITTLQVELKDRDNVIEGLKKANKNITHGTLLLSAVLEQQREQMRQMMERQKVWYEMIKERVRAGRGMTWMEGLVGGLGIPVAAVPAAGGAIQSGIGAPITPVGIAPRATVQVQPIFGPYQHTAGWKNAQAIIANGGPSSMAAHIRGYQIGELSAERSTINRDKDNDVTVKKMEDEMDKANDMTVEELEDAVGKLKSVMEFGKKKMKQEKVMRKKDWIIGGRIDVAREEMPKKKQVVIDLTGDDEDQSTGGDTSRSPGPVPIPSSSIMPTSSPERAEDKIIEMRVETAATIQAGRGGLKVFEIRAAMENLRRIG